MNARLQLGACSALFVAYYVVTLVEALLALLVEVLLALVDELLARLFGGSR